jgi:hypothetical protein
MHITDSYDEHIVVTDLTAAIKQAALFKQYGHKDAESCKRDDELKIYWTDLHAKLLKLRCECNGKLRRK